MSDYVRNVSVFYPISEELCEKLDCELEKPFNTEVFDDGCSLNYYLCYVLKHTYGEESTGFGLSRMLTQDETNKYVDLFSDYLNNIDPNKFKLIDYCYYNCCECKDYYKNNDPNFQIICQDCKLEEQAHNLISENDAQEIKEENDKQKEKHLEYWNDVLVQASIAAMQGIQESGHLLSVDADVLPKELAELSVKIAKCLVSKLKEEIGE